MYVIDFVVFFHKKIPLFAVFTTNNGKKFEFAGRDNCNISRKAFLWILSHLKFNKLCSYLRVLYSLFFILSIGYF